MIEMKKIKENLNYEEFEDYCQNIVDNMESATTYYGQQNEFVPYYGDLQRRHIYGEEENEHEVVLYVANYDEETGKTTYDVYDELG